MLPQISYRYFLVTTQTLLLTKYLFRKCITCTIYIACTIVYTSSLCGSNNKLFCRGLIYALAWCTTALKYDTLYPASGTAITSNFLLPSVIQTLLTRLASGIGTAVHDKCHEHLHMHSMWCASQQFVALPSPAHPVSPPDPCPPGRQRCSSTWGFSFFSKMNCQYPPSFSSNWTNR